VFLMEDGIRKNVTPDLHDRLVEVVRRSIGSCSPGVVLRNLVQDYVFEPAAVVLGPAEVAYRAQIGPLYERFGIRKPAAIPRLGATYLPHALASFFEPGGLDGLDELLTDPPAYAKSVYTRSIPADIAEAARELDNRIGSAIDDFLKAAGGGVPSKALGRMRARLFELRKKTAQTAGAVEEVGRAAAIERWPFLPELSGLVRPQGKAQERSLSALIPFLSCASAGDDLLAIAGSFIDDLLDGRANHVVYSCK
ncbi:MAG: bacillithiol biosynthesis BshC, partial [bacterium]